MASGGITLQKGAPAFFLPAGSTATGSFTGSIGGGSSVEYLEQPAARGLNENKALATATALQ